MDEIKRAFSFKFFDEKNNYFDETYIELRISQFEKTNEVKEDKTQRVINDKLDEEQGKIFRRVSVVCTFKD